MRTIKLGLVLGFSILSACSGDKSADDTADTSDTSDTSDTTDTTDTTDTNETGDTDTDDTGDTDGPVLDGDADGYTDDVDCDDSNPDINPGATDMPGNDIDEDCNDIPAWVYDYDTGLANASFEVADPVNTNTWGGEVPQQWLNIGGSWATQMAADNLFGDNGDAGVQAAADDGDKYLKLWPDNGGNPWGDESPAYQEWAGGADKTFYMSAKAMVHNSSPLKGATQAVVWIKCFDASYALQGDAQSIPLDANSELDTWQHLYTMVTCGANTTLVQAVVSLNTPDDIDTDGDGTPDAAQTTGNVYFDSIVFGEYNNDALPDDVDNDGDGQTENEGDCDDANAAVFTGAEEVCDGIDNNCSGDETDATVLTSYYPDLDLDGYGDEAATPMESCEAPSGYVTDNTDCDDTTDTINPSVFDNPMDTVDEDCSGVVASVVDYDSGLSNPSFENINMAGKPADWNNIGNTWGAQSASVNLYGDNGDSGTTFPAHDGNFYVKIWPDNGGNIYGDEAPVFQEWTGGAEKTFFISAMAMVHNSSPLLGASNAVVWIKCFDVNAGYALDGDSQSIPLDSSSTLDAWQHLHTTVTCGANTTLVQAVVSLNTPNEIDTDNDGVFDAGQSTGNVYFDSVMFGEYSN